MRKIKKWVGISGSWRASSSEVEQDVRSTVRKIILSGNGIVTGGALNVDYLTTDEVLKLGRPEQIKVFLPTTLEIYADYYRKRVQEGVIARQQAEDLISQLTVLKKLNAEGLIENPNNKIVNQDTYFERNSEIVHVSDELIAFQINNSKGTKDAIDKARTKGIPVKIHTYNI